MMFLGSACARQRQEFSPDETLARSFQSAEDKFDKGKFAEAALQLEALLRQLPKSFEVHELLGLVYASQSEGAKAAAQLEIAVRLKPDSATARTNLAASLAHLGRSDSAEREFRKALTLEPNSFEANHDLGEFYVRTGRIAQAAPLLEAAQKAEPLSYGNGYDLAQVYFLTGNLDAARRTVQKLAHENKDQVNTGELYNLLGQIEEKDENYVAAANEFEAAAHINPSEENLFAWGSEYLLHRTYDPAIEVFEQAAKRYPSSARLAIGLGISLYWRGRFEEAVRSLMVGVDLAPTDARSYLFLSKALNSFRPQGDEVTARFRRYAQLEPSNSRAQYYYAMDLWKQSPGQGSGVDPQRVEALLQKSIMLDPTFTDAHFQLGNLYSECHEFAKSRLEYERVLQLDPGFADAHYRLGQQYVRDGQRDRAHDEFAEYQRLRAERQAELDRQAADVQQFVYSSKAAPSSKP